MDNTLIMKPEVAYIFVGGFYMAMSVLHFILFMYNRHRKSNLLYSVGMAVAFVNFAFVPISTDDGFTDDANKYNIILSTLSNGALLYFISYYIIAYAVPQYRKAIRIFGQYYLLGFVGLIITFNIPDPFHSINLILRTSLYTTVTATCAIGLIKRIPNFYLIVIATAALVLTDVVVSDLFKFWGDGNYPSARTVIMILGYTAPFIAYSTYLSKDLALTGKKLMKEHINNEKLTREKYEQELVTRKLLEAQNVELERSVFERTREISQQKEELEAQAEKIQELDKIKSRFFANISHEFRTPLTLIQGPVKKRLTEAKDPKDIREFSIIYQNSNRLLQLVNQLLDLSRLESGTLKLRLSKVNLTDEIHMLADAFQSLAEVKLISFDYQHADPVIHAFVDQEKLTKVINNLLSNAFKFTPQGGKVTLAIAQKESNHLYPEGYAEIQVVDSGIGISSESVPLIFDRFYQVDNSQTRQFEGTGIGLAITREFVELHHGEILIDTKPGHGSTFTVRLPLGSRIYNGMEHVEFIEGDIDAQTLPSDSENERHDGASLAETILIIEDNADLRYYLKENMSGTYRILEAADGAAGLDLAIREVPDLIISDLMMPKLDGMEVCSMVKKDERTSHVPVILLTAKADIESRLEGLDAGADDYIPKPFEIEELVVRTRNLIQLRKKLREKYISKFQLKAKDVHAQSADERFLQRVMDIIEEHISDSSFSVERFARETGLSTAQLYRKIHALTGKTPNDSIRDMRLQRAADLLSKRVGNVAEVAYQVGFNNLSYFAKVFKEKYGQTPIEFLRAPSVPQS